jgi:hypothetical protein
MPTKDASAPQPLSQSSVASFVFGTIQVVLITIVFAILKFIAKTLTAVTANMGNSLSGTSTVSYEVTFLEMIALLLINVLPLMGVITGFSGIYSANKGYGGGTLALLGLMFSLLAITISISFAVLGDLEPLLQVLK